MTIQSKTENAQSQSAFRFTASKEDRMWDWNMVTLRRAEWRSILLTRLARVQAFSSGTLTPLQAQGLQEIWYWRQTRIQKHSSLSMICAWVIPTWIRGRRQNRKETSESIFSQPLQGQWLLSWLCLTKVKCREWIFYHQWPQALTGSQT